MIDPFGGGRILSDPDYQRILDRIYAGKLCFERGMLATLGTRRILARMLTNLKAIYFSNQEYAKALSIVERLVILQPEMASEIRTAGCSRANSSATPMRAPIWSGICGWFPRRKTAR